MLDSFGSETEAIDTERLDADLLMAEMETAAPPPARRQGWVYRIKPGTFRLRSDRA